MDKSDITLERMRTFVRVAERGTLSAVAREIGAGQSTITRHLRELEAAVGVPLLSRTTRRVTMTDEGQRYYVHCVRILRLVEKASEEARATRGAPAGTIRISCTAALGVLHVTRLLFDFQDRNPEILVDLSLSDERVNLVQEGIDVAIRLGPLSDSSMKLRAIGSSKRLLVATPSYLERHGRPQAPEELADHQGIRMSNIAGGDVLHLTGPGGRDCSVSFDGRFRVDHGLAAREALLRGRGIAAAHLWLVGDLVEAGNLEPVLPEYLPSSVPLNLLIVPERSAVRRVRLLIDFLAQSLSELPGIEP